MKKFKINSGKMIISDPCYELGTWCQGVIEKVKNGVWIGEVEYDDNHKIKSLCAHHESCNIDSEYIRKFGTVLAFTGGVDSGQFGYFDADSYREDEPLEDVEFTQDMSWLDESNIKFYKVCCDLTTGENDFGVLPNGIVSSSGYGDGVYTTCAIKDGNNEYIGFTTSFIDEDDE